MAFTLDLPEDLESQLIELSKQRGESVESISLTAISYYVFVSQQLFKFLDANTPGTRQNQLEKITSMKGKFQGSLSASEELIQRKRYKKPPEQ